MLQIAELQRRVQDLTTMNEMLLEQNAQYRQNNRNQSTPATPIQPMPVTQPIPPHVSFRSLSFPGRINLTFVS